MEVTLAGQVEDYDEPTRERAVRGAGRYIDRPCFAPYYDAVMKTREQSMPIAVKRDG